jgi:hypothetical protein
MWIYAVILFAIFIIVSVWTGWYRCDDQVEPFYSIEPHPKNFYEVVGIPLSDAQTYLARYGDRYRIRTVRSGNDLYRKDLSTIYIVVDEDDTVRDVL